MKIFEADTSDTEFLVKDLWRPMAEELERFSELNSLSDEVEEEAVEYFTDRLSSGSHYFYILEIDDKAAGFISFEICSMQSFFDKSLYAEIHELFIRRDFRRNGYAEKLIQRVERECSKKDVEMIQLTVNKKNSGARELYTHQGFENERLKMVKELD